MILQYCSDLHQEFDANRYWLAEYPLVPRGDILIIAGDTHCLGKGYERLPLWDYLSQNFRETYVLPGNHEYYGGYDTEHHLHEVRVPLRKNVWLVNNYVVDKPEARLIFTTLWSRIEQHIAPILLGMADFKRVRYQGKVIGVAQYNLLHRAACQFLEKALSASPAVAQSQIVVTHHLPSEQCNDDEFKGSLLNEAFCVDLTSFIEQAPVDAWIYGHSHRNVAEFRLGGTRLLTNQLGYVHFGEHSQFDPAASITV